jgi:hypothetical protein
MTDQPLTENERKLPPHLGGHFGNTNLDEATLCYLVSRYRIESMLDVGCGPGGMVELAWRLGLHAWGIDGDRFGPPWIIKHDYTTGPYVGMPADLIWCTEFVEHVEAQYQENYLATFATGRVLFLTAAPPGFPGHHHVNCLVEGTPVIAEGLRAATRRAYHGDVVTIVTASGHKLTVTPNHPVLTGAGWVAAERIKKGDRVVSRAFADGVVADVMPDDQQRPVPVEQIFGALVEMPNAVRVRMPGSAEDFHGDGRDGDINIVWANRALKAECDAARFQPRADRALQVRDTKLLPLVRERTLAGRGELVSVAAQSLTERQSFGIRELSSAPSHRLGPRDNDAGLGQRAADDLWPNVIVSPDIPDGVAFVVQPGSIRDWQDFTVSALRFAADGNAAINQDTPRIAEVDMGDLCEGGKTFAGQVAPDEVVSVHLSNYVGYVYNLHTDSSWYLANSIITHNCQPESYWMQLLAQHGWRHDREATAWVRQNGGHIFSQRQGLVFVRS